MALLGIFGPRQGAAGPLLESGAFFSNPITGFLSSATPFLGPALAVGSLVLGKLLQPKPKPQQIGPRLTDLTTTSTAFGEPIADSWGTIKLPGQFIDGSNIVETPHEVSGGKGFLSASPTGIYYTYSVSACWLFRRRPALGIARVWMDTKLVRNVASGSISDIIASNFSWQGGSLTFYMGEESQLPDPVQEALHGVGNVPAYRGVVRMVAENLQLANFANRVPATSAEVFDTGETGLSVLPALAPGPGYAISSWAHIDDHGEGYIMYRDGDQPFANFNSDAYRTYKITPEGVFPDVKVTSSVFGGGNNKAPTSGHADEPIIAAGSNDSISFWRFNEGASEISCSIPGGYAFFFSKLWILKNERFFIYINDDSTFGTTPHKELVEFSAAGAFVQDSSVFSTYNNMADMDASDDFIYGLEYSTTASKLVKVDASDLSFVDEFDLGAGSFLSLSVQSDTDIRLVRMPANASIDPIYLYKWDGDSLILIGSVIPPQHPSGTFRSKLIYSNGIYYYGGVGLEGSGSNNFFINRIVPALSTGDIPLATIVSHGCKIAGIPNGRYDVTELTDLVHGFVRQREMPVTTMLQPLMQRYFFDGVESDWLVKWKKRGRAPSFSIPRTDLAAHEPNSAMPDKLPTKQIQARQLPTLLTVKYLQKDNQYEQGQQGDEILITDFREISSADLTSIVMTDNEAHQFVAAELTIAHAEKNQRECRVTRKYVDIEPADIIELILPTAEDMEPIMPPITSTMVLTVEGIPVFGPVMDILGRRVTNTTGKILEDGTPYH